MYPSPTSLLSPPSPSRVNFVSDVTSPYNRASSVSDFEIEKLSKSPTAQRRALARWPQPEHDGEQAYRNSVARLLTAKSRPFAVMGRIPVDPSSLVMFFRSKSGITHSLDFPIDVEFDTPPALDVLIAACRPHPSSPADDYSDRESLYYPPNLPLTSTLELSNHPILETVRNTLFPALPAGHFLTAARDKLEVVVSGGRMTPQPPSLRNDGRVATIAVSLPVRYRGGALIVCDADGSQEKFQGRNGKSNEMEWIAFTAECGYEVETVTKGCKITMMYAVFPKTFGPSGLEPDPLITPSDNFLDAVSAVLNMCRGRKIAFYLQHDQKVDPSETLAESLVPYLKGGDSLLYHAIKYFKLVPELHWTAGGYIWPVDRTVECGAEDPAILTRTLAPIGAVNGQRNLPAIHSVFGTYNEEGEAEAQILRFRVEESGAIPLAEADIFIVTDWNAQGIIAKERVPFVTNGELEKLVVNVLLVTYVP